MKETLVKVLDYLISLEQIALIRQETFNAVVRKDYELASNLRIQETTLSVNLPTLEQFKEWKDMLIKSF